MEILWERALSAMCMFPQTLLCGPNELARTVYTVYPNRQAHLPVNPLENRPAPLSSCQVKWLAAAASKCLA